MNIALAGFDPFDRSIGTGSRVAADDWTDEVSIFTNEWGSQAATTFNPKDTDAHGMPLPAHKREKFQDLYEWHNGKGEQNRRSTIRESHISNDVNTFTSVLELPTHQRDRVKEIIDDLDLSSNNFGGKRYEKIILAVCSLVSDEALSQRPNPSVDNRLICSREFRDLMEVTKLGSREHNRIRQMLREKTEHF